MRTLIATWGVGLVVALLGQAIVRLTPVALEPWSTGMTTFQQVLYVSWAVFNLYAEGYRGFQLRFSPRVVSRAFHLADHPRPLHVIFALPYCMSLFHSTKRQLIVSWVLVIAIVALVILVRSFPQPWRGIVDGGVVIGLAWGTIAIVVFYVRGLLGNPPPIQDLPTAAEPTSVA